jgi:hypothetical protein
MNTNSLIEILALLDLSTLHKISSKNKRLFDIYNCDRFWRMKLTNVDLISHKYLIDFISTSKQIYEQYEKYQKRFDILSNELRRNGLNHFKFFLEDSKCSTLSKKLINQRDDIKTLSICKKHLKETGFHENPYINYKTSMTIIADYVTSKFHNLIYLDISRNCFWFLGQDVENLKRILDHPSIIFVHIHDIYIKLFDDSSFNERQLRKLIWIQEKNIEYLDYLEKRVTYQILLAI